MTEYARQNSVFSETAKGPKIDSAAQAKFMLGVASKIPEGKDGLPRHLDDGNKHKLPPAHRAVGKVVRLGIPPPGESRVEVLPDDEEKEMYADEQLSAVRGATDDALKDYLRKISRYYLLTAAQEVELAQQIEAGLFANEALQKESQNYSDEDRRVLEELVSLGTRAYEEMICANLRLVVSIAKRYQVSGIPMLDLIQFGNEGLIRAVEKYDYKKGNKFSTYASGWIIQKITRGIGNEAKLIRVPVHFVEDMNAYRRIVTALEADLGRPPSDTEIMEECNLSLADLKKIREIQNQDPMVSTDLPLTDELVSTTFGELLCDSEQPSTEGEVLARLSIDQLDALLQVLTDEEKDMLCMRYGLHGQDKQHYEAIATKYNTTKQTIINTIRIVFAKLRHPANLAYGLELDEDSWRLQALCAQVGIVFFFPKQGNNNYDAKKVCDACDVCEQCLDEAIKVPHIYGFWGGKSPTDRLKIRQSD